MLPPFLFVSLGIKIINKVMQKTLKEYDLHVQEIKKLIVDTYGATLTNYCKDNLLPAFSAGIMMLHLQDPTKPVPDMEMVLFSTVKEASKIPFAQINKHFNTQEVVFRVLDEALELTANAGFGDLDLN